MAAMAGGGLGLAGSHDEIVMEVARMESERHPSPRAVSTGQSESAASLLCVELDATGLPVDRPTMEGLIEDSAGPRPDNEAHAGETRRARDVEVLRHAPGRESAVGRYG